MIYLSFFKKKNHKLEHIGKSSAKQNLSSNKNHFSFDKIIDNYFNLNCSYTPSKNLNF
jgi:hypothetical protein